MKRGRTQNERLLARLRQGSMCGMEPHRWQPPIYRAGARIFDLRGQGHTIRTKNTCPEHDGAAHAYYTLVSPPLGDTLI